MLAKAAAVIALLDKPMELAAVIAKNTLTHGGELVNLLQDAKATFKVDYYQFGYDVGAITELIIFGGSSLGTVANIKDCGGDMGKVTAVSLTPDPPVPGKSLDVVLTLDAYKAFKVDKITA